MEIMKSNENVSILNKLNCRKTLPPPRRQVEEPQPILSNNKTYLNSIPRERTERKVTFKNCETVRQSRGTKRDRGPNSDQRIPSRKTSLETITAIRRQGK